VEGGERRGVREVKRGLSGGSRRGLKRGGVKERSSEEGTREGVKRGGEGLWRG
jgi:hypothetical protein